MTTSAMVSQLSCQLPNGDNGGKVNTEREIRYNFASKISRCTLMVLYVGYEVDREETILQGPRLGCSRRASTTKPDIRMGARRDMQGGPVDTEVMESFDESKRTYLRRFLQELVQQCRNSVWVMRCWMRGSQALNVMLLIVLTQPTHDSTISWIEWAEVGLNAGVNTYLHITLNIP